jgi:hypothetical protein
LRFLSPDIRVSASSAGAPTVRHESRFFSRTGLPHGPLSSHRLSLAGKNSLAVIRFMSPAARSPATNGLRIGTMRPSEISLAVDWAAAEGWNPGLADDTCFAAADRQGFFIGELDGGLGGQGAAVFKDGEVIFGPRWAKIGPINHALKLLGIGIEPPAYDGFETVGLHLHRDTEDWFKQL